MQVEAEERLYAKPANRFVAGFVGSPRMNLLDGTIRTSEGAHEFVSEDVRLALPGPLAGTTTDGCAALGVRPKHLPSPTPTAARFVVSSG